MDEKKTQFLTAAYKAHKDELLFRRRADTLAGAFSLIFYIVSIRMINLYPPATHVFSGLTVKCIGTLIYYTITTVTVYFLVKNYNKMCELQQTIARFDTVFGFFEKGVYLPDESLYPEKWKSHGMKHPFSAWTRSLVPILFGIMAIISFWLREL